MMTPNEIRGALMTRGIRVVDIAKQLGIKHSNVSRVISGNRPTFRIRRAIATSIGKSVSDIWPDEVSGKA